VSGTCVGERHVARTERIALIQKDQVHGLLG
jgi:hypothetical protein